MSKITRWDDYFIHQTEQPIAMVAGSEADRLDSCYFGVLGIKEQVTLSTGLRSYPNTGNMACYALAWRDRRQHNFRATRQIEFDRADTAVGPMTAEIVEPLKRWHLRLEENEYAPVSYDLEAEGLAPPYLSQTTPETRKKWPDNFSHMCQPCRYRGRLTVAGHEYSIDNWIGPRNRFWGVLTYPDPSFHIWIMAIFPSYSVFIFHHEKADGEVVFSDGAVMTEKENLPLTGIEHRLTCEPQTRKIKTAEFSLTAADGTRLALRAAPLEMGIMFSGAPCAGGFSRPHGRLHQEGEIWDLRDTAAFSSRAEDLSAWAGEFQCRGETAYGFFEYKIGSDYALR